MTANREGVLNQKDMFLAYRMSSNPVPSACFNGCRFFFFFNVSLAFIFFCAPVFSCVFVHQNIEQRDADPISHKIRNSTARGGCGAETNPRLL